MQTVGRINAKSQFLSCHNNSYNIASLKLANRPTNAEHQRAIGVSGGYANLWRTYRHLRMAWLAALLCLVKAFLIIRRDSSPNLLHVSLCLIVALALQTFSYFL